MPDLMVALASLVPGVAMSVAILAVRRRIPSAWTTLHGAEDLIVLERRAAFRGRLARPIDRAGWRESPERLAVLALCVSAGLAALGLSASIVAAAQLAAPLAVGGACAGIAGLWFALRRAVGRRRKRLIRELAPLMELFVLELGGGGSPLSALGSVTMQVEGELAAEIRRLLIASQVSGSATFEMRLRAYADALGIPPLTTLATVLTASREYGTGVTEGVRALAADLRRAQRRELIAHSRRALNHVLFPAAIGVLLPFLAILMYPAVSTLQANLR